MRRPASTSVSTSIPVVKMNGTRNEFVVVDGRTTVLDDPIGFARQVCDRRAGLGADGLLLLLDAQDAEAADARMRVINADGSEAEMCGNGIRCVARYLHEHDGREEAIVETIAGPIATKVVSRAPYTIAEEMGIPRIGPPHVVAGYEAVPVDLGNPHVVIAVGDPDGIDLSSLGARIERDPRYPNGANVHFVRFEPRLLHVRHWERGAGATAACGTGAVACAAVAIAMRGYASPVTLHVPGGTLVVVWDGVGAATLIGDAVTEFSTTFP